MGSGWPLTGRAEELRAINGCVDTVGAAGIVLAGAAGVGKTRLARETLTRAGRNGRGCRLVAATASAQSVPLGAFADYADRLGPDPLARVRDVVDAVTRTASRGPIMVGIDDAHLLDEQSALVVHQIVRRHLATVVLTVRTGEPAPDAVTALWKDELLPRMEVQPLSKAETAALLETVLGDLVDSATAERVWNYTRGNVLYLRQLLADELASGHFARRSGIWTWDTHPTVSATLAELIDATMGRQPPHVLDVLDVLAVADSLELEILRAVVGAAAIEEAETGNLVTVDGGSVNPVVRLAHPMFGEVRRIRASSLRLRRLRSAIVAASPPLQNGSDPVGLVRRAALVIDSDTTPDPQLLIDAASAAIQLMDPVVAERFARHAVEHGGGTAARVMHINALVNAGRLDEALAVNADLRAHASTPHERATLGLMRAGIFVRQNATEAAQELDRIEDVAAKAGLTATFNCVAAATRAFEEDPPSAVDAAIAGLTGPGPLAESAEFAGVLGLVTACRDLADRHDPRVRRARVPSRACFAEHRDESVPALPRPL